MEVSWWWCLFLVSEEENNQRLFPEMAEVVIQGPPTWTVGLQPGGRRVRGYAFPLPPLGPAQLIEK